MNWKDLMNGVDYEVLQEGSTPRVSTITYNSKKVTYGAAFVAVKGATFDGHQFVRQAASDGAVLAVVENTPEVLPPHMTVLKVASSLEAMPIMAANFYENPSEGMEIVGVTGTKGKTTTTTLIQRILMADNRLSGLVGTIENKIGNEAYPSEYTTPQAFDLQAFFARMRDDGVSDVVMEVSSHSLALHRVERIHFDYAVFTNLSLDHLDYHKTMQAYLEAKMQLFKMSRMGLVNLDDAAGEKVLASGYCRMMSYGIENDRADICARNVTMDVHGIRYELHLPDGKVLPITYPFPGRFNVYNTMAAASVCVLMGIDDDVICKELARKDGMVKGRFQTLHGPNDVTAIVDYSHSPDALKNALDTIAEFGSSRVITVVGCGGDRDRSKRPVMGQIVGDLSDYVVLTSDNPRTEDPMAILAEIEPGVKQSGCPYEIVENRREAIQKALSIAGPNDIVLVAGKGHENYQIIGREKFHFDDVEEIENYWKEQAR